MHRSPKGRRRTVPWIPTLSSIPSRLFPTIKRLSFKRRRIWCQLASSRGISFFHQIDIILAKWSLARESLPREFILHSTRLRVCAVVHLWCLMTINILQKSSGTSALRTPYLRVVHLELSSPSATGTGGLNPFGAQFTPDEEEEFNEMARGDGFYERFAKSVAPSIFGSLGIFRP